MTEKVALWITVVVLCAAASRAESPQPGEYQVKAAFLYNFAKFVEWPARALPSTSPSMTLCVLGDDPFDRDLEQTVQGKTVGGRELVIKRFKVMQELTACHILFISASESRRLPQILAGLKGSHVFTVGDTEQFTELGGMINFVVQENKIRFEINVDAAERAALRLSSKLLKLAKRARPRK